MAMRSISLARALTLGYILSKSVGNAKVQESTKTFEAKFKEEPALFMREDHLESILYLALSSYSPQDAQGAVQFLSNFTKFIVRFQNYWVKSVMDKVGRYNNKHPAGNITLWVYVKSDQMDKLSGIISALWEANAVCNGTVSMLILWYSGLNRETIGLIKRDVQMAKDLIGNPVTSSKRHIGLGLMFDKINCHPAGGSLIHGLNVSLADIFIFYETELTKFDKVWNNKAQLSSNQPCENMAPRDKIVGTLPLLFDVTLHPFHYDPLVQRWWSRAKNIPHTETIVRIMYAVVVSNAKTASRTRTTEGSDDSEKWLEQPVKFHPETVGVSVDILGVDMNIDSISGQLFASFSKVNLKIALESSIQVNRLKKFVKATPGYQKTGSKSGDNHKSIMDIDAFMPKAEIILTVKFPKSNLSEAVRILDHLLSTLETENVVDEGKVSAIIFEWESCSRPDGEKNIGVSCDNYLQILEHIHKALDNIGGLAGETLVNLGILLTRETILDFVVLFSSSQFRERVLNSTITFNLLAEAKSVDKVEKGYASVSQAVILNLVQYEQALVDITGLPELNILYSVRLMGCDASTYENISQLTDITRFWEHLSEWSAYQNRTLFIDGALMMSNSKFTNPSQQSEQLPCRWWKKVNLSERSDDSNLCVLQDIKTSALHLLLENRNLSDSRTKSGANSFVAKGDNILSLLIFLLMFSLTMCKFHVSLH